MIPFFLVPQVFQENSLKCQTFYHISSQISEVLWKLAQFLKIHIHTDRSIGNSEKACGTLRVFMKTLNTNVKVFTNIMSIKSSLNKKTYQNDKHFQRIR